MNTRIAGVVLGLCLASSLSAHVTVDFSTYLGGSLQEQANAVASDSQGNLIVVGLSDSGDFPVRNALPSTNQPTFGNWDFFVTKFDPQGRVLFSTRIGGDRVDVATAVAVDEQDQIYVLGSSSSTNFPLINPLPGGGALAGADDAVLMKLSPSGEVLFSSYLGGSRPESPNGLTLQGGGVAYVTLSSSSTDLPSGGETRTHGPRGEADVVVLKVNTAAGSIEQTIRIGGSAAESALGGAIANGWLHLAGWTASRDFPVAGDALGERSAHAQDGFVVRVNLSSGELALGSYFGNGHHNGAAITAVATDASGHTYLAGNGAATNLPPSPGSVGSGAASGRGPFVTKIRPNGTVAWSAILAGATAGASSLAVDAEGKVILAGGVASAGFPVAEPVQATFAGGSDDAFVSVISRDGTALLFSTYYGGNTVLQSDTAKAVTVNGTGRVAVAGRTSSRYDQAFNYVGFPVVSAFQDNHAGNGDAFLFQIHGYNEIVALPRLSVERVDGNSVVLRFPPGGFQLEATETLVNPQWSVVSVVPGASSATNNVDGRARYFRLRQP